MKRVGLVLVVVLFLQLFIEKYPEFQIEGANNVGAVFALPASISGVGPEGDGVLSSLPVFFGPGLPLARLSVPDSDFDEFSEEGGTFPAEPAIHVILHPEQDVESPGFGMPPLSLTNENILLAGGLQILTSSNLEQGSLSGRVVLYFDICVFGRTTTVMDVFFMIDDLSAGIGAAELEIAKYAYDPDIPSQSMEPDLIGVYPAFGYTVLGNGAGPDTAFDGKSLYMVGTTGISLNLQTGTYRVSVILRNEQINSLAPKTFYSIGITGAGGSIQVVASHLDVITFGASLGLAPNETLEAFTVAYDEQFSLETDIKEQERIVAAIPFARPIVLMVNGSPIKTDSPPVIEDGRTLVPVRALVEALGYVVAWEPESREVGIYDPKTRDCAISMTIDSSEAYYLDKDSNEMKETLLDVSATIVNGRTLVPARFIAEAIGCNVDWDGDTRVVSIITGID